MTTKSVRHGREPEQMLIHELAGEAAVLVQFASSLSESIRELTPHAPPEVLRTLSRDIRDTFLDLTVTVFSAFSKADRLALLSELHIEHGLVSRRNGPTH